MQKKENNPTPIELNENIKKRIRKLIEEIIIVYEDEFNEKYNNFCENSKNDIVKNKGKISKIGIQDGVIESFVKEEVEDMIGLYLLQKNTQND